MSEHKYKEVYNKGFEDGKRCAFTGYCQQCYDELPLKDQVELMIKYGANKPNVIVKIKEEIETLKAMKEDLLLNCGDKITETIGRAEIIGMDQALFVVSKYIAEWGEEK